MTKIFYSPDDEIATAAERFGEETGPGGGVVFNVKWRRYKRNIIRFPPPDTVRKFFIPTSPP